MTSMSDEWECIVRLLGLFAGGSQVFMNRAMSWGI